MFSKILPFVLLFILLLVVSCFFFFEPTYNFFSNSKEGESKDTCTTGEIINCTTDLNCEGKKYGFETCAGCLILFSSSRFNLKGGLIYG